MFSAGSQYALAQQKRAFAAHDFGHFRRQLDPLRDCREFQITTLVRRDNLFAQAEGELDCERPIFCQLVEKPLDVLAVGSLKFSAGDLLRQTNNVFARTGTNRLPIEDVDRLFTADELLPLQRLLQTCAAGRNCAQRCGHAPGGTVVSTVISIQNKRRRLESHQIPRRQTCENFMRNPCMQASCAASQGSAASVALFARYGSKSASNVQLRS